MSFLNWFSSKPSAVKPAGSAQREASASREKSTVSAKNSHGFVAETPMPQRLAVTEAGSADSVHVRNQRYARREHLYLIIRESMTRMGVLSGSYKFKVLSVDPQGAEFMVMMDMMDMEENRAVFGADKFHEMEGLIMQSAWSRFEVAVSAVYWRTGTVSGSTGSKAAVREKPNVAAHAGSALVSSRAGFEPSGHQGLSSSQETASSDSISQPLQPSNPSHSPVGVSARKPLATARFDPIEADEFSAFKEAMKAASSRSPVESPVPAGSRNQAKAAASKTSGIPFLRQSRKELPSYTLLTGFEETQLPDPGAYPEMSRTQYGDLR